MSSFFYIISLIWVNCVKVLTHHYSFYEVIAFNSQERGVLYEIETKIGYTYFFNAVTNEAATLMNVAVNSCCTNNFEEILNQHDIEYSCVNSQEIFPLSYGKKDNVPQRNVEQSFLNWDDIIFWVENKLKENSILSKTVIGKTYEHRDIFVLKISTKKSEKKMAVFVVAGEEGRDWLSSAILLNYVNKILDSAKSSKSLLRFYDIYFIPILNPDGFVYTKQKDRMWAKNRRIIKPIRICENAKNAVGVNIDRNWFYDKADSLHACNSIYVGSQALSEEETQGLSYILNSVALKLLAFINLRGFGNLITLPYSDNEISVNHNIVMEIMKHASAVLKMQFNKSYPVGTTANYFYNLSGNMPDWIKRNLNIPVVFTVYMQHEKFLPKEFHITPVTEQFESLLNITLVISKEIYGSLYNAEVLNTSSFTVIIVNTIISACTIGSF